MSASARRRIALAQKKRWAAAREQKAEAEKPPEKKRKFSMAGLKAIQEGSRKRWAKFRKEQKVAVKKMAVVAGKKTAPKKDRKAAVNTKTTPVLAAAAPATV
jgi:hypothetical protein